MQRLFSRFVALLVPLSVIRAAPPGFPESGNGLWYTTPGRVWSRDYLPVGNGHLAAMTGGGADVEILQLNIESLWSGGPFQDPSYNGGNHQLSEQNATTQLMASIHETLMKDGVIGGITGLGVPAGAYGSYAGSGYLVTTLNVSSAVTDYSRWLDLDQGIASTSWTQDDISFLRTTFCSHPATACVQHLTSTNSGALPSTTVAFSSALESGLPTPNVTCLDSSSLSVRGLVGSPGMLYELVFKGFSPGGNVSCAKVGDSNATLTLSGGASESWISWVGDTEYDMAAGDASHDFSFKGVDPHAALLTLVSTMSASYNEVLAQHVADVKSTIWDGFSLDLGQQADFDTTTSDLVSAYEVDEGNVYIEWLLFNYGRYLLASSARGLLPANLQGKWGDGYENAWGADSNINIQMNYWIAEITGMDVMKPLFDYFEKTWVPRGEYTAEVLYNNSRGWVVHNEIFGHTGMKEGASQWANYPEAGAWMMIHVWDHFDYTGDVAWWKAQGWPLLKSAALFQLDKLLEDAYHKDEQEYITIGCAHAQQLIWQLFNAVIKGFEASGDHDQAFLQEVIDKREVMDKGIHIGSWGQLQEWKIDHDDPLDTHRHLSHLIVLDATRISLIHRGNGTGPDADSGWEKAWRAACWAQLADAETFYHELTYTIERDFGGNLFSLYNPQDESPIFQIDANFGFPAAVINALIQTPDVADNRAPFVITLLPALPSAWASGSIRGARARKGVSIDMDWEAGSLKQVKVSVDGNGQSGRQVNLEYAGDVIGSFQASKGTQKIWRL
ncbi:glycoside hydrolase family 95 protein [Hymenopellis radicata]|nr:glycoside hydrolase family 95 protein [Hymenopellis radicata]